VGPDWQVGSAIHIATPDGPCGPCAPVIDSPGSPCGPSGPGWPICPSRHAQTIVVVPFTGACGSCATWREFAIDVGIPTASKINTTNNVINNSAITAFCCVAHVPLLLDCLYLLRVVVVGDVVNPDIGKSLFAANSASNESIFISFLYLQTFSFLFFFLKLLKYIYPLQKLMSHNRYLIFFKIKIAAKGCDYGY
jgi:hypothetical protein